MYHLSPGTFALIKNNYQSKYSKSMPVLYAELGWDDLIKNPAYENTCAVRLHLACIAAGVNIPGTEKILKGPFKDKKIDISQKSLSTYIRNSGIFGKTVVAQYKDMLKEETDPIKGKGIISFFGLGATRQDIAESNQGHIDVFIDGYVNPHNSDSCLGQAYWMCREIWYWPMK
jgi:hypothetical protein